MGDLIELKPNVSKDKQELAKMLFYMIYAFTLGRSHANEAFVPFTTHEQRLNNNYEKVYLNYIQKELKKQDSKLFLKRLDDFVTGSTQEELIRLEDYLK